MAQIDSLHGYPLFSPDGTLRDAVFGISPTATATDITYRNADGSTAVFHGNFTLDGGGHVTSGTVSGFDVSAGATLLASGSAYALSATALVAAIVAMPSDFNPFNRLIYSNVVETGTADDDFFQAYSGVLLGRGGDDFLGQFNDGSGGAAGFIVIKGGKGDDVLDGGDNTTGRELFGGMGNDDLTGGQNAATLHGGKGDDTLQATHGPQSSTLYGGDGDDLLSDGSLTTYMYGGKGADTFFLFDDTVDVIHAFNVKHDVIGLSTDDYPGVPSGFLTDVQFLRGAVATTPDQRILYDANSGNALYDADGSGVIAPVVFAVLPDHLKMHAHNFVGIFD